MSERIKGGMMAQIASKCFPESKGKSLAGIEVNVPEDLAKGLNLLIVGCYPWQQAVQEMWTAHAEAIGHRYEGFEHYECIITPDNTLAYEGDSRHERLHGISSYPLRQRLIALQSSPDVLLRQLEVPNDRQVHVFLLNPNSIIIWRSEGHPTIEKILSLVSSIHHQVVIEQL